jgi:hypothetical protein
MIKIPSRILIIYEQTPRNTPFFRDMDFDHLWAANRDAGQPPNVFWPLSQVHDAGKLTVSH